MSQPILIAVGGSGQNVLAAYLRLASMAGFAPAPFYVVDSDTKGPQFHGLSELKRSVKRLTWGDMPLRWSINPFPTSQADRRQFGELFPHTNDDSRVLFESLFSEEAEKTQIRTGMYGRPAIGATSMRLKFQQDDDDLRELKQKLQGGEKHVILIGSCFGGTGSGGVPILAQEFHRLNQEPGYSLRVQAIVFLPWFRLVLREGETGRDEKFLHERLNSNFEPNAAASINFFRNTLRDFVETVVFMGVRDPSAVERESRESVQGETVHPLNLLAAVLAQNLFSKEIEAPRGVAGYWYDGEQGLRPDQIMVARENGTPALSLAAAVRRAALHEQWLGLLRTFFDNFWQIPRLHRPGFISFALERIRNRGTRESEIVQQISHHLTALQGVHAETLKWIDQLQEQDGGGLLRLDSGAKRIQSQEYQEMYDDPLPFLAAWSDREQTLRLFDPRKDFSSPAVFAERFSELFLGDMTRHFSL